MSSIIFKNFMVDKVNQDMLPAQNTRWEKVLSLAYLIPWLASAVRLHPMAGALQGLTRRRIKCFRKLIKWQGAKEGQLS